MRYSDCIMTERHCIMIHKNTELRNKVKCHLFYIITYFLIEVSLKHVTAGKNQRGQNYFCKTFNADKTLISDISTKKKKEKMCDAHQSFVDLKRPRNRAWQMNGECTGALFWARAPGQSTQWQCADPGSYRASQRLQPPIFTGTFFTGTYLWPLWFKFNKRPTFPS